MVVFADTQQIGDYAKLNFLVYHLKNGSWELSFYDHKGRKVYSDQYASEEVLADFIGEIIAHEKDRKKGDVNVKFADGSHLEELVKNDPSFRLFVHEFGQVAKDKYVPITKGEKRRIMYGVMGVKLKR